jgi:hypothetical protein
MKHEAYPVVTICGSMRYFDEMLTYAHGFTHDGYIVLMPFVVKQGQKSDPDENIGNMLDDMHKRKIDMSDLVAIVGSHRGESTTSEIAYAKEHDKRIIFCKAKEE